LLPKRARRDDLAGSILLDHSQPDYHALFPVIVAHFVGIYALVIVVGDIVDWIGRTRSLSGAC
jgi:hypothetical protein